MSNEKQQSTERTWLFRFYRYVSQGGDTALQENEARLKELTGRAEKLKREKEAVSNEIDKLKEDIAKQQVRLCAR